GGGPQATTIELAIYQALSYDYDPARAAMLALLQMVCCLGLVLLSQRLSKAIAPGTTLLQGNRQIISYVPRTEPAPPEHAIKMDSFRDVWMLRGKYVAFVLMGESFLRSPAFTVPESAQRWANQIRQEGEVTE
ncbi:cell division modulator, partial [Escherichia coli O111:H11 str. CVM9455]